MKPVIDLTKEYGLVFDGGGARGAYQIGAWKALREAGVKICAVAGTSVGALNGAMVCMGDLELAENIWKEIRFSQVMDVDDEWMQRLFDREINFSEFISEMKKTLKEGGVDITPLKHLIHDIVDEKKIRESGMEFCLLTFSLTDLKELDLSIRDIPEGQLEDFLLASAYLLGFKNEKLHGKKYIDGGVINNVPLGSLIDRGYHNIIEVRIYGPGREPKIKLPEDALVHEVAPRVRLGSIIEFEKQRSRQNLKIGYYDTLRMLYGLQGKIYYIEQSENECYYKEKLHHMTEAKKREIAFILKLPFGWGDQELYMGMLEASAKLLRIPKYAVYTVEELLELVKKAYMQEREKQEFPEFVEQVAGRQNDICLKGRNFLTLKDFTKEEIIYLLDLAADLKEKKHNGIPVDYFRGKNVALIFEKTSTRTRCSFEIAASDLGMGSTYLDPTVSQIGKKESIKDTARVLGRMYDGIEYRGYGQEIVEELAKYAGIPVWNGLTNEYHPTQMLADLLTIREHFGTLEGIKFAYLGDARYNMGNSLMIACSKMGMHFVACAPKKYFPNEELVKECEAYAAESGGSITLTDDVWEGTKGANVIATDVWVSMGEPDRVWKERINDLTPYKVTADIMKNAGEEAVFLHCLPAFHDLDTQIGREIGAKFGLTEMEVTDEVFEADYSLVFDEAENRMHTIKAVMVATL